MLKADLRGLAAGAMLAALAVGCGQSTSSNSSGTDEASKSADQIFADAIAAWRQVPAAHLHGTGISQGASASLDGLLTQTSARVTITSGAQTVTLVVAGGNSYAIASGRAAQVSGSFAVEVKSFTLAKGEDCETREHGALTKGSISTVNGHRVIAIADDGHAPGASPGTAYVALDGPPLIIRVVQMGTATPGGSLECGHDQTSSTTSSNSSSGGAIDWDYPAQAPDITPPPGAAPAAG